MGGVLCDFCDNEIDNTVDSQFQALLLGHEDSKSSGKILKRWTQYKWYSDHSDEENYDHFEDEYQNQQCTYKFIEATKGGNNNNQTANNYFDNQSRQSRSTACLYNDDKSQAKNSGGEGSNLAWATTKFEDRDSQPTTRFRHQQHYTNQMGEASNNNHTFTIMERSVDQVDENSYVVLNTRFGQAQCMPLKCFKDADLSNIQMNVTHGQFNNDTTIFDVNKTITDEKEMKYLTLCPQELNLLIQQKFKEIEALKYIYQIQQQQQNQPDATVYDYNLSQLQELNNLGEENKNQQRNAADGYEYQTAYPGNFKPTEQAIMPVDVAEMNQEIDAAVVDEQNYPFENFLDTDKEAVVPSTATSYQVPKRKRFASLEAEQNENQMLLAEY